MRNLAEIKDNEALDLLADMLEPMIAISSDPKLKDMKNASRLEIVQYIIRNHKEPIMQVMAILEGVPFEDYHCNVLTLPATLLELFNTPEISKLFT